jgi:rare lipoprotein A
MQSCHVPSWPRLVGALGLSLLLGACGTLPAPTGGVPVTVANPVVVGRGTVPPAAPAPVTRPAAPAHPPDAMPSVVVIPQRAPNIPYELKGQRYDPADSDVEMVQSGIASWYGRPFHGRRTASGEVYDMNAMTAAHKTMPLPSFAIVRNPANQREVVVRVNDRGPFKKGRIIDLSRAAARKLGIAGIANVQVRRLTNEEIASGSWKGAATRLASSQAPEP